MLKDNLKMNKSRKSKTKSNKLRKNRKWKVKFSEEATRKLDALPDNVYNELIRLVKGLKEGKIDPIKMGRPVDWVELDLKLICPECNSNNVEWLLDKNSNEVTFHCFKCDESFWMTYKEYKVAIRKNPDKLIR